MQRDEKLAILDEIFDPLPKHGIESWGQTPTSRWYICDSHPTAEAFATFLLSRMHLQGVLPNLCPHRYDPAEIGHKLIIEPMDDVPPLE